MEFTKDPSTHPANGPLTEERLIRVRDELAAAAKRSDGGNLGYMMADAAKAIDEVLSVRKAGQEPVAYYFPGGETEIEQVSLPDDIDDGQKANCTPLYAAPQLPQPAVEALKRLSSIVADPKALPRRKEWIGGQQYSYVLLESVEAMVDDACRAAMLQGNHRDLSHPVDPQVAEYEKIMQQAVPDGWVMVPKRLTAENGAKAALIGEFSLEYSLTCHECFGEGCEDCSGEGAWTNAVPIDWSTIKDILAKAIDHFAAAPQQEVKP